MRVTFVRLPDHQPGHALVERDDGVVYRLQFAGVTAKLPHDLHHGGSTPPHPPPQTAATSPEGRGEANLPASPLGERPSRLRDG